MSAQFDARQQGNCQFPKLWPDNHLPSHMLKDADLRTDLPTLYSDLSQVGFLRRGDILRVGLVLALVLRSRCLQLLHAASAARTA